ncbi:MAG TPA: ferritin [Sedimentisphaerales bacterium]|nr:ferritin [Sedimentisphaerales bacterium]
MAISNKISDAMNKQINAEMYSAYMYLSMAAWFEKENFAGFANWMKVQAQEEMTHAMKFYDFIIERQGAVKLMAIDCPPSDWKDPLAIFQDALKHEQKVTGLINGLTDIAIAEKDYASQIFLQWFVTEQVEEEASADAVVQQLKLMAGAPGAILMLDRELGRRVFTPPPAEASD